MRAAAMGNFGLYLFYQMKNCVFFCSWYKVSLWLASLLFVASLSSYTWYAHVLCSSLSSYTWYAFLAAVRKHERLVKGIMEKAVRKGLRLFMC